MGRPRIVREGPTRPSQEPAAPCRGCGTVWGYLIPRCNRSVRQYGLCRLCYDRRRVWSGGVSTYAVEDGYEPTHREINRRCAIFRLLAPRSPQGYAVVFRVHRATGAYR